MMMRMAGKGMDRGLLVSLLGGKHTQPLCDAIYAWVTLTGACLVINQRLTGT
jgi:hypothetical protein